LTRYQIVWSPIATHQLQKLDHSIRRRIVSKVEEAASDPLRLSRRLVGSPYSRLRVGDWRVILEIDKGSIRVIVLEVKHRRTAYR
jgi:mRNA interferase RelE/StbE